MDGTMIANVGPAPLPPVISFFKTLVRVARVSADDPALASFKPATERAFVVMPWVKERYLAHFGKPLPASLYGGRLEKVARYTNGVGLSARKRAEILLARLLLEKGKVVKEAKLERLLSWASTAEADAIDDFVKRKLKVKPKRRSKRRPHQCTEGESDQT